MLGKLLKHEFVATGRIMLPVLAAVTGITLLANLMLRFGDLVANRFNLLSLLMLLVVGLAVIAIIAAEIMTIVLMVLRFYRNLLGPEGYLMHSLPVNVHQLVWSKLIVSCVWIVVTNLLITLLVFLSVFFIGKMALGEFFQGFPSWGELMAFLHRAGISSGRIVRLIIESILLVLSVMLGTCLHFYAAMSLGHIFSKDKVLLSVVFFVGISVAFSVIQSVLFAGLMFSPGTFLQTLTEDSSAAGTLRIMSVAYDGGVLLTLGKAALLYFATVFGLKKGLNLA